MLPMIISYKFKIGIKLKTGMSATRMYFNILVVCKWTIMTDGKILVITLKKKKIKKKKQQQIKKPLTGMKGMKKDYTEHGKYISKNELK